jgi:addiction module HigA family antidote
MTRLKTQFKPDYTQHPGTYLEEVLDQRQIRKTDFAARCGRPAKTISEIIAGKAQIIPDTALQFERVLDVRASLWLQLEADYQLSLARVRDREELAQGKGWALKFPINEMRRRGYIGDIKDDSDLVAKLLDFFGVSSVGAWEGYWMSRVTAARFKNAGRSRYDRYALAAWLRRGDQEAAQINCEAFNDVKLKECLPRIRALTLRTWPKQELLSILSSCGVSISFVPDLHNLNLRGAAYWASKDKAVVILSDRLKREHKFWFALFHELMHILLHSKKALFIDFTDHSKAEDISEEEREADEGAANFLIAPAMMREFQRRHGSRANSYSESVIRSYAKEIGVSPALLLARLQREELVTYRTRLNVVFADKFEFST